jgi:membrane-associated HD superfamily phosphohydrolase
MDNTPSIEFRNSTIPSFEEKEDTEETTSKNYLDSLNEYFKLKHDYETKKKDMMKKAFKNEQSRKMGKLAALSVKPPCINCKRPVGTIFSNRENDTYTAICGDKGNPCNLNIKIYNGKTINLPYILNIYKEEIEDIKDTIISQKLDTLFSYVTEEKSVQLFKKELETYNSNSKIFKNLLDKYNELYENKDKKEMIQKKSETIYLLIEKIHDLLKEYEKTNNKSILKSAINMQINELYPEIRNMRLLKNEVLELNEEEEGKFKVFTYPVALNKIDYDFGEKATVIKFNKA